MKEVQMVAEDELLYKSKNSSFETQLCKFKKMSSRKSAFDCNINSISQLYILFSLTV